MMSVPQYQDCGPISIPFELDLVSLKDKSVIITGGTPVTSSLRLKNLLTAKGASGLGKAYAEAFVAAGLVNCVTISFECF
jgi:hypothetical protein